MRKCLIFAVAVVCAGGLHAATISFTATGTANGQNVSGQALFNYVPGATGFTVTLNNLTSVADAGQLLSDLEFNLSAGAVALTSSSGTEITVNSDKSTTTGSSVSTGWGFGNIGGAQYLLCVICGDGVSDPSPQSSHTILGTVASDVNSSVAGNGPHNPFLESGATFTFSTSLALPVTGNPFGNVILSWGTTFGNDVPAGGGSVQVSATPEPVSMFLTGGGLIGLSLLMRRRRAAR